MIGASQIRDVVFNYVNHGDLDAFLVEFAKLSHDIHKNGDAAAIELSQKIESLFAISRSHGWQECKLRDGLRTIIESKPAVAVNNVLEMQFNLSVNQTAAVDWVSPVSEPSGTSRGVEFGSTQYFQV